jgi:hypothetical protein
MPKTGDKFITILKTSHLKWGSHRYTNSREIIYGEGYLHIPAYIAKNLFITNSNHGQSNYIASSSDGYLKNVTLLAGGSSKKGNIIKMSLIKFER